MTNNQTQIDLIQNGDITNNEFLRDVLTRAKSEPDNQLRGMARAVITTNSLTIINRLLSN